MNQHIISQKLLQFLLKIKFDNACFFISLSCYIHSFFRWLYPSNDCSSICISHPSSLISSLPLCHSLMQSFADCCKPTPASALPLCLCMLLLRDIIKLRQIMCFALSPSLMSFLKTEKSHSHLLFYITVLSVMTFFKLFQNVQKTLVICFYLAQFEIYLVLIERGIIFIKVPLQSVDLFLHFKSVPRSLLIMILLFFQPKKKKETGSFSRT